MCVVSSGRCRNTCKSCGGAGTAAQIMAGLGAHRRICRGFADGCCGSVAIHMPRWPLADRKLSSASRQVSAARWPFCDWTARVLGLVFREFIRGAGLAHVQLWCALTIILPTYLHTYIHASAVFTWYACAHAVWMDVQQQLPTWADERHVCCACAPYSPTTRSARLSVLRRHTCVHTFNPACPKEVPRCPAGRARTGCCTP